MLSVVGATLEAADNSTQSKHTKLTGISLEGRLLHPRPEAAHKLTAAQTHNDTKLLVRTLYLFVSGV